jgi:hypothetical protein
VAVTSSEADRALHVTSVREPGPRSHFLAALRELGREGGDYSMSRLQRLIAVDGHFHTLLARDQAEFLTGSAAPTDADRDFVVSVQRIFLEAANGYQRFLRQRAAWATSRESLDTMFRVTGLALNAVHAFVKWGYFGNEAGRSVPWKQLHALHALAEADGYSQVPFVVLDSRPAWSASVQALYLRTLLLDMLHTGKLSRAQIEIADGWLAAWCNDYALDTEYSSRHHLFCVDVASDSGLHLVRRDRQGASLRYVRAENLKAQIDEAQAALRQGHSPAGTATASFPMGEQVALLAVLEKLYLSIVAGSENRQEERAHLAEREVEVVVGFPRLLAKVHGQDPAADIERWRVQDLSGNGYGLVADRPAADAVTLHGVVALRNQATGGWIACTVVRKLSDRARGEMLVGLEVLSYRPVPVDLVPADGGDPSPALYLPGQEPNGRQDTILAHARDFAAGGPFVLHAGGAVWRVAMSRIVSRGSDWVRARFEIESKA